MDTKQILKSLKECGMTQMEISEKTGIPQANLSRWASEGAPKAVNGAFALHRLYVKTCSIEPKMRKAS